MIYQVFEVRQEVYMNTQDGQYFQGGTCHARSMNCLNDHLTYLLTIKYNDEDYRPTTTTGE